MSLEKIRELNSHVKVFHIRDEEFLKYGKLVKEYDFTDLMKYMEENTSIPECGNIYIASDENMEKFQVKSLIENEFYGTMPIEIGYCNGKNSTLNGLEYHKSSEINVAITDMVLLLGRVQDIKENKYDSRKVEAFYVPKGTAFEMYQTTLHLSPCKVTEEGFKCIVILPRGTNTPLENKPKNPKGEAQMLFMRNKWLLAHPERKVLVDKGAHVGIVGENLEILGSKISRC